jgi:arginase family enzyme
VTHLDQTADYRKLAIIRLPVDENSSFLKGAADARPLIRTVLFSEGTNLWTENGTDLGEQSRIIDIGDVVPLAGKNAANVTAAAAAKLLKGIAAKMLETA